jgi:putative transposase|tara:strand:- start:361 stop:774 length:414 start_codon:yes stop_codon:yes gene_type:complete
MVRVWAHHGAIRRSRRVADHEASRLTCNLRASGHHDPLLVCSGSGLVSHAVQGWLKDKHVDTHHIDPGSPWQNAYFASLNSIFRIDRPDRWLLSPMTEERVVIQQWLEEYKTIRLHGSLADVNPAKFLQSWTDGNLN